MKLNLLPELAEKFKSLDAVLLSRLEHRLKLDLKNLNQLVLERTQMGDSKRAISSRANYQVLDLMRSLASDFYEAAAKALYHRLETHDPGLLLQELLHAVSSQYAHLFFTALQGVEYKDYEAHFDPDRDLVTEVECCSILSDLLQWCYHPLLKAYLEDDFDEPVGNRVPGIVSLAQPDEGGKRAKGAEANDHAKAERAKRRRAAREQCEKVSRLSGRKLARVIGVDHGQFNAFFRGEGSDESTTGKKFWAFYSRDPVERRGEGWGEQNHAQK